MVLLGGLFGILVLGVLSLPYHLVSAVTVILVALFGICLLLGWISGVFAYLERIERRDKAIAEDMQLRRTPAWWTAGFLVFIVLRLVALFLVSFSPQLAIWLARSSYFVLVGVIIYGFSRRSMEDS